MLEDGEKIPKPSTIDDLAGDPNRENAVAFLVSTNFGQTKTMRVNITARENQIERIDRLARQAGMTRSAYMVQSATSGVAFQKRGRSGLRIRNAGSKRVTSTKTKKR